MLHKEKEIVQINIVVFWYVQDFIPNTDCCTVGCAAVKSGLFELSGI